MAARTRRFLSIAAAIAIASPLSATGMLERTADSIRADGAKLAVILIASLLALLCSLFFAYLTYRESRRARAALRDGEDKFAVTLNSIGDAVLATDANGLVTLLNPVAEQLSGWTLGEAAGLPAAEIFHIVYQQTREPAVIPITATLAKGIAQGLSNHILLISRTGREYPISDSCAPIRDRGGQVIGAVLVFRDVTDEYSAREYSESIINTIREPLIALDQDLRVVSVSRSFYEFFKAKPEETVGQLFYDLGNKQWDIPKLRELLETILPRKASFDNYVVEHDFAAIGKRTMLLNARQIQRGAGKERVILLAIEDITERKEIQDGLEKAHSELEELTMELERAARVKSEFLANMSHELRTPLNSINGFSEVLYDETFGKLNEKQKKYVSNVLTSGRHLLALINQILDMSKVEAGKMNLSLASISPKALLNEITRLIADMAGKKGLRISLDIAADLPDIEGDELRIREILYNLLSNAVKFTPANGELGLRAKRIGSYIEIEVRDTGIGIASENLEKVFEGFFRVDTPFSRLTEGTGLGLPLARKLVELHGGKLFVESAGLDKGTQVRFTLPIVSRKAS